MKLLKLFLVIAIVSAVTFSCKSDKEKAKDDLKEAVEDVKDAAEETAKDVSDAVNDAAEATGEAVSDAVDATADAVTDAADATTEAVSDAAVDVEEAAKEIEKELGFEVDYPKDPKLEKEIAVALDEVYKNVPGVKKYFGKAYGFAYFPEIKKGGLVVGGAGGKGLVFEGNKVIGSATLTQITVGAQAGGQKYQEVIYFENKAALDRFKNNKFKLATEVSAVALEAGASADLNYQNGVAVYTYGNKGVMAEATVGTQKFKFKPGVK
jgi:lipid-binding SYLF domain-containing protein/gas vesicle protein